MHQTKWPINKLSLQLENDLLSGYECFKNLDANTIWLTQLFNILVRLVKNKSIIYINLVTNICFWKLRINRIEKFYVFKQVTSYFLVLKRKLFHKPFFTLRCANERNLIGQVLFCFSVLIILVIFLVHNYISYFLIISLLHKVGYLIYF